MKKLFAIMLALMLVLTMGSALAQEEPTYSDASTVTVTKKYVLVGAGSSPAETFTLEQVGDGSVVEGEATSAPDLGTITGASFDAGAATTAGAEAGITINLPEYDHVGIYEYTLQEVAGTNAGVAYYGETIKLVVTVINDTDGNIRVAAVHTESEGGEKSDTFINTYSAGKLEIKKNVKGNLGDTNKYFKFTVTLRGEEGKTYASSYAVSGGSWTEGTADMPANPTSVVVKPGEDTEYTFYLKHEDTITIANLPYGVTYTVVEADYTADGYETTGEVESPTAINSAATTVTVTNTNDNADIDTGITTDNLPYIVLMGIVVLAGVAMIAKRRMAHND